MTNRMMMRLCVLPMAMLMGNAAFAADQPKPLTQAQLALDHGPHAQVTPAVKRKRLEANTANKAASGSAPVAVSSK